MAPEAITAEKMFVDLKEALLRGRFAPSTLFNVHALAAEYEMSISPVRDACHRLVGERLLEARAGGGFQLPLLSEAGARDLYGWHDLLVRTALGRAGELPIPRDAVASIAELNPDDDYGLVGWTVRLFLIVGGASNNAEHLAAIQSANDRLHHLRRGERWLRRRRAELSHLWCIAVAGEIGKLRSALAVYHRRRLRNLAMIVGRAGDL